MIRSNTVVAFVTVQGAHVGPATFTFRGMTSSPYSLAPWLPGEFAGIPPLLDNLRGDFFCLPFGEQDGWAPHGEVAGAPWSVVDHGENAVTVECRPHDIGGRVTKTVSVDDDGPVVYQEIVVEGVTGEFPYGTHPIVDISSQGAGGAHVSTSPIRHAQVFPGLFSDPARGEHQILAPGARFTSLSEVPAAAGGSVDMSRQPLAKLHEDLVMLVNDPEAGPLAWSAVSCADFVWVGLKKVSDFPATVLWISNGGRPQEPWLSRHTGRLGVEDVCAYFSLGVDASRDNDLRREGVATVRSFDASNPTVLRFAHVAVVPPAGFGQVSDVRADDGDRITITDDSGVSVVVPVRWSWVLEQV